MFLRGNSSDNPARRKLLESVRQHRGLLLAAFAAMLVSAAATGGYAWLVAPLLQSLEANSGLGDPRGAFDSMDLSVAEIVIALLLIGALRALTETVRVNLTAKAQPGIVLEFRAELLRHLLDLEPVVLLRWPPGELASRIQVEVHGIRMLLQLVHPGHPEHSCGNCSSHYGVRGGYHTSHPWALDGSAVAGSERIVVTS